VASFALVAVACTSATTASSDPVVSTTVSPPNVSPTVSPQKASHKHQHHSKPEPAGTLAKKVDVPGAIVAMTAGSDVAYALANEPGSAGSVPLAIYSLTSMAHGAPLGGPSGHPTMIATAEGYLWVADRNGGVTQLDPSSLSVIRRLSVAGPVVGMDASADRIWIFTRDAALGLAPSDGASLETIPTTSDITHGAASPDGATIYVSLAGPVSNAKFPVLELDPSTGAIVARTRDGLADLTGISGLTATNAGVWIFYATGMMGSGDFARRSDLRYHRGAEPSGWITGTNAIQLFRAGPWIWQSSGGLECFDPITGKELGLAVPRHKQFFGLGDRGVVDIGQDVWAANGQSLYVIKPPSTCPNARTGSASAHEKPPSPPPEGSAPSCLAEDLQLSALGPISEATGQHTRDFAITNTSSRPCSVDGYPTVTALDAAGQSVPFVYRDSGDQMVTSKPPSEVVLVPGDRAFVRINKYRCDTGDVTQVKAVQIALPGGGVIGHVPIGTRNDFSYCGHNDPGSTISVSPFVAKEAATFAHH
jgi:uncharacterized protein DUF4232